MQFRPCIDWRYPVLAGGMLASSARQHAGVCACHAELLLSGCCCVCLQEEMRRQAAAAQRQLAEVHNMYRWVASWDYEMFH